MARSDTQEDVSRYLRMLDNSTKATHTRSPKDSHKPVRVPLPHPLMDPRKNPVCLLVKDPQREYKDLLEQKRIQFISRVVGMEKLQGKVSSSQIPQVQHSPPRTFSVQTL